MSGPSAKEGLATLSGATYEDLEQRISEISDQDFAEHGELLNRMPSAMLEDPIEKRIQDAELLRDLYVRNGKART